SYIVRNGLLKKLPTDPKRSPIRLTCAPSIPDTLTAGIVFKVRVAKDGKANISTRIGKRSAIKTSGVTFPVEITTDYGTFRLDTTSFYKPGRKLSEDIIFLSYSNAAELLSRGVSVKMVNKKADIIQVDMVSPNAFFTRDIVGALIRNYNATGMEQQYARTSATYRFLNERIDSATMHLNNIENQIAQYKKTHNMADFTFTARTDASRYEALHDALRQAETELDVMELVKGFLLDPSNNLALIPQVGESAATVQTGIKEYNKLLLERMAVASNARDNNVAIKLMDDQLKLMRDNISTSLNKAIEAFRFRLSELRKEVARADSRLGNIPTTELEYGNIARRQAVEEQLYLYLLQQREETSMKMSNIMPRGVVVDQPHILMDPVGLSKAKKMIVAFIMGLLIPAVYLFVRIRMRNTATTPKTASHAE
ncbi:MAG: hypothetical protein K2O12_01640, partial [Muribaculaceae bacterium]|nr:hypothetical protein [Muribaculaceae bacterium]